MYIPTYLYSHYVFSKFHTNIQISSQTLECILVIYYFQILDISSKPVSEAALTDISSDATGHAACDIDYDCDQYECDSWDECEQDSFS